MLFYSRTESQVIYPHGLNLYRHRKWTVVKCEYLSWSIPNQAEKNGWKNTKCCGLPTALHKLFSFPLIVVIIQAGIKILLNNPWRAFTLPCIEHKHSYRHHHTGLNTNDVLLGLSLGDFSDRLYSNILCVSVCCICDDPVVCVRLLSSCWFQFPVGAMMLPFK